MLSGAAVVVCDRPASPSLSASSPLLPGSSTSRKYQRTSVSKESFRQSCTDINTPSIRSSPPTVSYHRHQQYPHSYCHHRPPQQQPRPPVLAEEPSELDSYYPSVVRPGCDHVDDGRARQSARDIQSAAYHDDEVDRRELPSLLSHMSIANTFDSHPIQLRPQAFDFEAKAGLSYNSRPFNSIDYYGERKRSKSSSSLAWPTSGSTSTYHEKRRGPTELQTRTKKSKLSHRYFRSQDLLSPPTSSSSSFVVDPSTQSSSPPLTSSSASFLSVPSLTSSSSSATTDSFSSSSSLPSSSSSKSSRNKAASPAWWPSVSLSSGEGRFSRFMPRESTWVGDGKGWVVGSRSNLIEQERKREAFEEVSAMSSRSINGLFTHVERQRARGDRSGVKVRRSMLAAGHQCIDEAGEDEASESDADEGSDSDEDDEGVAFEPMDVKQRSPVDMDVGTADRRMDTDPIIGVQAKEELLSVLRMRVGNAGGTTASYQSGLRFKKWVVWNSWTRKSTNLTRLAAAATTGISAEPASPNSRLIIPSPSVPPPPSNSSQSEVTSLATRNEDTLGYHRRQSTSRATSPPTSLSPRSFPTVTPSMLRSRSHSLSPSDFQDRIDEDLAQSSPDAPLAAQTPIVARAFPASWGLGLGMSCSRNEGSQEDSNMAGDIEPVKEGCVVS